MKKILHITVIAVIAVGLFHLIEACNKAKDAEPEPDKEVLCGGYTDQRELSAEDLAVFRQVMGESQYTPLSVATQVVAGVNYRFLCRYYDTAEGSTRHCLITIYQPLQGEPVLSEIQDVVQ